MEKIRLEICCGTTCYMLGASQLLKIESVMPDEWQDKVEVSAISCMNMCVEEEICAAPFVKINGELLRRANVESVLEKIGEIIREEA